MPRNYIKKGGHGGGGRNAGLSAGHWDDQGGCAAAKAAKASAEAAAKAAEVAKAAKAEASKRQLDTLWTDVGKEAQSRVQQLVSRR